jgi:hypothetical protein
MISKLVLIAILFPLAAQGGLLERCFQSLVKTLTSSIRAPSELPTKTLTQWYADNKLSEPLKEILKKDQEFREKLKSQKPWRHKPPPKTIEAGGKTYSVIRVLGSGLEGTVYLVDINGRPTALKIFDKDGQGIGYQKNMQLFDKFERAGVNVPKRYSQSSWNQVVLMEYIDGIPMSLLGRIKGRGLEEDRFEFSTEASQLLTPAQQEVIAQKYLAFLEGIPIAEKPHESNILLDFTIGDFVVVDPR